MPVEPRRWKRWVLRAAGWSAAGVVIDFLVSVACVLRVDQVGGIVGSSGPGGVDWLWAPRNGWPAPTVSSVWRCRWAELDVRLWMHGTPDRQTTLGTQQEYRAGWPFRAWRWRRDWARGDPQPRALVDGGRLRLDRGFGGVYWVGGPSATHPGPHILTFPITPNGWAFWGAAVLYGGGAWGLAWVVVGGRRAWRRAGRVRRGECLRCGYPLGAGAAVCPECGAGGYSGSVWSFG